MCRTPTTTINFENDYGSGSSSSWLHRQAKIIQGDESSSSSSSSSSLEMKAFYVRFCMNTFQQRLIRPHALPDHSITLVYLPRLHTNTKMSTSASSLQINGSTIRPDSPAFVTLHRLINDDDDDDDDEVVFCSRDLVRVSQAGVEFQVYLREHQVFKGSLLLIKPISSSSISWQLECNCELQDIMILLGLPPISEAKLCLLTSDSDAPLVTTKVDMTTYSMLMKRAIRGRRRQQQQQLEEIPEERELEEVISFFHHQDHHPITTTESSSDAYFEDIDHDDDDDDDDELESEVEMELEGVRWAVDLGIWVVCLGLAYLASKASSKSNPLRSRRPTIL